ncbi:MAG: pitrilysin family protein [bacterium]
MKKETASFLTSSTTAQGARFHSTYAKSVLSNGIRVISEEIPHVRSVSVGLWFDVGSRDENALNNGISHFIEHMVFKGTKNRSIREIARSLESVGGYLNAFTGKEHTCYYARVLDEHTYLALDVLSDLIQHPIFPERELEKEKGVVIEELRNAEDDPDDIIHDYFDKSIFGKHPLGYPVIGTESNLRSFTRDDLFEYVQKSYLPVSMIVAAAGNIKHEALVSMAQTLLGDFQFSPSQGALMRRKPGTRKAEQQEYKKPIKQAHICLGAQSFGIKSKQRYPLLVLNTLFGDGMSSRLFQNIREKHGFAYSVYSYVHMMSDSGVFGSYIGTDSSHINHSIDLIYREMDKILAKPISRSELRRTKAQLKGSMMLSLESIPNRMIRLGSSELYFHEHKPIDSIIQQIDAVTTDDVYSVAKNLYVKENLSTVIFYPTEKEEVNRERE